jgi:hypothetical protein
MTWRKNIETMSNYTFPDSEHSFRSRKFTEFPLATGGTPIRSMVVSTWRSGSSFFGGLLSHLPANFYFYEPMLPFGQKQFSDPLDKIDKIDYVKNLFKCNFNQTPEFINIGKKFSFLSQVEQIGPQFMKRCTNKEECFDPEFLEPLCELFPVQTMKLVRMRMNLAAELLRDER